MAISPPLTLQEVIVRRVKDNEKATSSSLCTVYFFYLKKKIAESSTCSREFDVDNGEFTRANPIANIRWESLNLVTIARFSSVKIFTVSMNNSDRKRPSSSIEWVNNI